MPCQVSQLHGFSCRRQIHFYVTKCQVEHRSTEKKLFFQEMMNHSPVLNSLFQIQTGIILYSILEDISVLSTLVLCPFYFESWVGGMLSVSARWILK